MPINEVRVPPLGDFDEVPVVEVLVGPGDAVKAEEALVTLESDKATMDVPAPSDGVIAEISVSIGDSVSEGSLLLTIDSAAPNRKPRPSWRPKRRLRRSRRRSHPPRRRVPLPRPFRLLPPPDPSPRRPSAPPELRPGLIRTPLPRCGALPVALERISPTLPVPDEKAGFWKRM